MKIDREVLHALPKTDLHCHLDGSVRPSTVRTFLEEDNRQVPENLEEQLTVDPDADDLTDYLEAFEFPINLLQSGPRLKRVAYELAEDASKENIWYLEVRFAPFLHTDEELTADEVIKSVLRGIRQAEREHDIQCGVILTGLRQDKPEVTKQLAKLVIEYKDEAVVALDLAGAERGYPAKDHLEAFYRARNENVNLTIHAGEDFGPESIHQAIHRCGAHRIGHGVRLHEDSELMHYANNHRIPLEVCLTSNVQTNAVQSFDNHPMREYLDLGLRVTLNTDNRTVSDTTMTDEFYKAVEHYNLSLYEIRTLVINGFKSAFLTYSQKEKILQNAIEETEKQLFQRGLSVTRSL
ncbi:MAG: adenosine deaminase [bacterium]